MTDRVPLDGEARRVIRRYYLAMSLIFFVDTMISFIFCWIHDAFRLFALNIAVDVVVLLGVNLYGASRIFAPIRAFIQTGENFEGIERRLTQLPLRSAYWVAILFMVIMSERLFLPRVLGATASEVPLSTWADTASTIAVQTLLGFVLTYFIVSGYLEGLCHFLFRRHGVNLSLFFGNFGRKIAVALGFSAIAPLLLIAVEILSYTGERLEQEIMIDLIAAAFVLPIVLYWVSRSLTNPLRRLEQGMDKVAAGDLQVRLPVTSNEEVGELTARFNQMTVGLRERDRLRETFGKYVSESVASQLLQESPDGRLTGQTREATLMFTDIDGFTTLSERADPDALIAALDEYLAAVLPPIQRNGGVVNTFIGDGLFASFNLPLLNEDHAAAAVAAALEIVEATQERVFSGGLRLPTRIGINTGLVIGGTIGAGDRLSYTLLGDAVNTAARLQELNKRHGTRILVAQTSLLRAGPRFKFTSLGDMEIRGRSERLPIHRVDGRLLEKLG
ncbi:MAG: HAMP domain-containing protein [Alphaproteobacteria bacterium]|nr:HAMP domain-containing protein [Alphaproteobacteria bacterium]MCW5739185.1 HAMP domain-containing protein [Alphaproteobacteria bacterium]